MSVSTAVSRITGFVRNWAMAYAMGVTIVTSSYVVANNIPNMVYELVAGGILSSVFIPIFIERMQRDGEKEAWQMASSVFNLAMIVLGVVALAGTVWAEPFVRTQTFRIPAEEAALATYFFRFFAVQIVFYGVSALFTGVLNSYRYFFAPAAAPIFNNLVVIVTLLGFYLPFRESNPELAVTGLAIGTTLGVVVMALFQIPSLWRIGIRYTPKIDLSDPSIRKMGKKMIPIFIYVATNMVALSFRNAYAFEVAPEGPAALQYAWMFYQLPYGIFAVALATAIFPELSSQADRKDWTAFKRTFSRGLRATGVLVIPLSALLIALSVPVITLYRAGDFAGEDVPVVAHVLGDWSLLVRGLHVPAAFLLLDPGHDDSHGHQLRRRGRTRGALRDAHGRHRRLRGTRPQGHPARRRHRLHPSLPPTDVDPPPPARSTRWPLDALEPGQDARGVGRRSARRLGGRGAPRRDRRLHGGIPRDAARRRRDRTSDLVRSRGPHAGA
jgi:putative peptidoglycan lipid II flippase